MPEPMAELLERERRRAIRGVLEVVERYVSEGSKAHDDIRRELMDKLELMVSHIEDAICKVPIC